MDYPVKAKAKKKVGAAVANAAKELDIITMKKLAHTFAAIE